MKKILRILYRPYQWLFFVPLLALSALILGGLAAILVFIVKPKTASLLSAVPWARFNAYLTPMIVKVSGRENIDKRQPYVIAANHQSLYDILVVYGWLGLDFKWVMKKELRKIIIFGIACERLGHLYIDRTNHMAAIQTLQNANKIVENGSSVMFFPEGTRSKDGRIGEFRKGAFRTALDLGVPILPITITGTRKVLPAWSYNLFPGKAKMIIHKPIDIDGYKDDLGSLMEKTKDIISGSLED